MMASPSAFFKLAAIINGVHPDESYTTIRFHGQFRCPAEVTDSTDCYVWVEILP